MPGPRHMGGVIAIGPDNNLYVSVGDLDGTFRGPKYDTMAQNYLNSSIIDGRRRNITYNPSSSKSALLPSATDHTKRNAHKYLFTKN